MTKEIEAAYTKAVGDQLKANNNTAWASAQSVAVIEAITDAAYLGDAPEGFDAIRPLVKDLCNASAFFAKLTKLPKDNPFHIAHVATPRGTGGSAMSLLTKATA